MAGPQPIDPELVISHQFPEGDFTYSERDVVLYALGVGACSGNAVDEKELKYVYHNLGQPFVKVLPTFAVLFPYQLLDQLMQLPGLQFNPALLLHGQQYLEICKPLPTSCNVRNEAVVAGLHDKGKAAVIEIETTSYDKESGEALCKNRSTLYLRGAGGFSKSSSMYTYSRSAAKLNFSTRFPETPPFAIHEESTQSSQALLYRLSGDYNPLHSDPVVANIAGHQVLLSWRAEHGEEPNGSLPLACLSWGDLDYRDVARTREGRVPHYGEREEPGCAFWFCGVKPFTFSHVNSVLYVKK